MRSVVTVLVIGDGAEMIVACAALAKQADVRVAEVPHARGALELLRTQSTPIALAIATTATLEAPADELLKTLEARGIALVGIADGLSEEMKQRARAAGVKEIHDRPREWRAYSELIESVIERLAKPKRR